MMPLVTFRLFTIFVSFNRVSKQTEEGVFTLSGIYNIYKLYITTSATQLVQFCTVHRTAAQDIILASTNETKTN
jgi:hypothetical protein